ncbi:MAG: chemotaxis protein CheW [Shewanella sp.]|nr:chemotaxis protein CheW [Shewanella sp.]MCF1429737.1 chemotaxis protein CheW [Shewanella sp.]MCF1438217.1 chemotaxis protein CheW [Shewanella sp.]MCF1457070.1 chemotaxis protein CheW [Shewanella sp.]
MSGAVDSTVSDYFSVLLREPDVSEASESRSAEKECSFTTELPDQEPKPGKSEPHNKHLAEDVALVMTTATLEKPRVDRALLEHILAPEAEPGLKTRKADVPKNIALLARAKEVTVTQELAAVTRLKSEPVRRLAEVITEADTLEGEALKIARQQEFSAEQTSSDPATQTGAVSPKILTPLAEKLEDEFQALFFSIAGLTLAVPLVSLGGIIRREQVNHIFGRPEWYLGLQTHRGELVNVVDTYAWVMREHTDKNDVESKNYRYVVQLSKSNWGLACESLLNATRIDKSQVNWRTKSRKHPWLAGVVKEQMCGILNVDALITTLDEGLGYQEPIG